MDRYKVTIDTWNKLADRYQERFMDLDLYNDTYDRFCNLLEKQQAEILEIACGPGNITRYLLQHRPDFKILATDAAPAMLVLAKENNPGADVVQLDCRELLSVDRMFDGIVCGFVMPYLTKEDCGKLIQDSSVLLAVGGVLYISAIEGDYEKSTMQTSSDGQHSVFMYYHEASYLTTFLKDSGFEISDIFRKPYCNADGSEDTHLIMIGVKK
jgi:trans-aconitate methyltransferase